MVGAPEDYRRKKREREFSVRESSEEKGFGNIDITQSTSQHRQKSLPDDHLAPNNNTKREEREGKRKRDGKKNREKDIMD